MKPSKEEVLSALMAQLNNPKAIIIPKTAQKLDESVALLRDLDKQDEDIIKPWTKIKVYEIIYYLEGHLEEITQERIDMLFNLLDKVKKYGLSLEDFKERAYRLKALNQLIFYSRNLQLLTDQILERLTYSIKEAENNGANVNGPKIKLEKLKEIHETMPKNVNKAEIENFFTTKIK